MINKEKTRFYVYLYVNNKRKNTRTHTHLENIHNIYGKTNW